MSFDVLGFGIVGCGVIAGTFAQALDWLCRLHAHVGLAAVQAAKYVVVKKPTDVDLAAARRLIEGERRAGKRGSGKDGRASGKDDGLVTVNEHPI